MELGKLFIGGISWDTSEERLREYFEAYGGVVEVVIMRDRATGRARGFGFVVFADSAVAEKVVREKHIIDGRAVEAKKAVPRDNHQICNRNSNSTQGSPGPARTKKIFVGGLASTVTESDFKRYFDQFGTITDVVVMYDHNTQRPRGFGFITYDSEEAVDKALLKTFHELNGKMVEVKRAVPKELAPGPTRSQSGSRGMKRVSSFLSAYSLSSQGGYGMRVDGRFSPATVGQSGYLSYSSSNYSNGLNLDSAFGLNYGADGDSGLGYGHVMNSCYSGSTNRYGSPISGDVGVAGNGTLLNTIDRSFWGNTTLGYSTNSLISSNGFVGYRVPKAELAGKFGSIGENWGSFPGSAQGGGNGSLNGQNIGYGPEEYSLGGAACYGRKKGGNAGTPPYYVTNNVREGVLRNLYEGDSFYSDIAWGSSSPKIEGSTSFGYQLGAAADATHNDSVGFVGGYGINARSNRGIAA